MAKIEPVLKSEIQRLTKREIRSTFLPLRREVRAMRLRLSSLSKSFSVLDRFAKEQMRQVEKKGVKLEATPEEVKASRLTPDRIRGLRKKLGLSMRELGILTRSSIGAVLSWEKGKFKPRGDKKAALVALRRLRKRGVKKLLLEKGKEEKGKEETKKRRIKRVRKPQPRKKIASRSQKTRRAGPRRKK
jgi:DNA-binding transcriptional regulator YiaG